VSPLPWPKKLLFSILPLLVLILLGEGLLRVIPLHRGEDSDTRGVVISDPDLIWRLKPHSEGPLATNELGFRDGPFQAEADRRLLLLGDSVAWGDLLKTTEQAFPHQVERELSRRTGMTVELINAAVPGYSTFQELRYLRREGLDLAPELVILQFCLNDVVERYTGLAEYGGRRFYLGVDTRRSIHGVFGWLLRWSRIFEEMTRLASGITRDREALQVTRMARPEPSPELEKAWELALTELEGIRTTTAEAGLPLALVITPYRFQLEDPAATGQPQRRLVRFARERGIPALDLLPAFHEHHRTRPEAPLFFDANHFSQFGHRCAAGALTEFLLERFPKIWASPEPPEPPESG